MQPGGRGNGIHPQVYLASFEGSRTNGKRPTYQKGTYGGVLRIHDKRRFKNGKIARGGKENGSNPVSFTGARGPPHLRSNLQNFPNGI